MNKPTEAKVISAAEELTLVARYKVDVNDDGSGDYRIGSVIGLASIDKLRQGFGQNNEGDALIPLVRCVLLNIDMPASGRLFTPVLRSRLIEGFQLHYDSRLAAPNLRLEREEIAAQAGELVENESYQLPGAKWSLSVLGETAFSAAQRGLYLAGAVVPIEFESDDFVTPNRGYMVERANNMYCFASMTHKRLYEMSPAHDEAVRTNGIG